MIDQKFYQANLFFKAGQLPQAEAIYTDLLSQVPANPEVHFKLGLLKHHQGHQAATLACLKKAKDLAPENAQYWTALSQAQLEYGMAADALETLQGALRAHPGGALAHAFHEQINIVHTELAGAHYNKGVAMATSGLLAEAEQAYRLALQHRPDFLEALVNLGNVCRALGKLKLAEQHYLAAIDLNPSIAMIYDNLATTQKRMNQQDSAKKNYKKALELDSNYLPSYNNLGNLYQELADYAQAEVCLKKAVALAPNSAESHNNLGLLCKATGRLGEAKLAFVKATALAPAFAEAHNNLGNVLVDLGFFTEAEAAYRQALKIKPGYLDAYSNLLLMLNYTSSQFEPELALAEAMSYGKLVRELASDSFAKSESGPTPKKLRVGFVSGDFRNHPVGYFLENVLFELCKHPLELIAYTTTPTEDELTARIKPCFAEWHSMHGLSDKEAAKLVHRHQPHILVDLAGHTAFNRLPVFAYKPAPVQVSWLGYFATTGLAEMDYLVADAVTLPLSEEGNFTEEIWRLPNTRLCFSPPTIALEPSRLPALDSGHITFGCFSNLSKINGDVIEVWAKILHALPSAKILLKAKQLDDQTVLDSLRQRFIQAGAAPQQLHFEGQSSRDDYFKTYHRVDIVLDPFPYPGGTTTMEALWMGVPVLTRTGERFLCRQGHGMLANIGLHDWVADTHTEYIEKAVAFSKRLDELAQLRMGLRASVLGSPMFDAQAFASHLNDALWGMWQKAATSH